MCHDRIKGPLCQKSESGRICLLLSCIIRLTAGTLIKSRTSPRPVARPKQFQIAREPDSAGCCVLNHSTVKLSVP